jgi:CheY-like chemotaxis protein
MVENIGLTKYDWSKKTILIAEDEESNYRFLEMVLLRTKIKIVWAKDGLKAVEMAKECNPDIILMDIKMPIMDGFEATRKIKILLPTIPIIAQTAYAMDSDEKLSFEAGCSYHLSKPIRAKTLIEVVAQYIEKT